MPEDTWDWQKVGNSRKARGYPKLSKARATQKATGYSELAIGIEGKKGKDSGPICPGSSRLGSRQDNQDAWTATVVAREAGEWHDRG